MTKQKQYKKQKLDYWKLMSLYGTFSSHRSKSIKKLLATDLLRRVNCDHRKNLGSACLQNKYITAPIPIEKKIRNNNCRAKRSFRVVLCPTRR